MTNAIDQNISQKPVDEADLAGLALFINREAMPLLRALRDYMNARFGRAVVVTADYTVQKTDELILVNAAMGDITVRLPSAVGWFRELTIMQIDSSGNHLTIYPFVRPDDTAETIGSTSGPQASITGVGILARLYPAFGSFYRVG